MEEDLIGQFSFFRPYILPPIEGRVGEGSFFLILVIARAARA